MMADRRSLSPDTLLSAPFVAHEQLMNPRMTERVLATSTDVRTIPLWA